MYSSMVPRRCLAMASDWVRTRMPSRTGSVHAALKPGRPSISTMHIRQDPNERRLSVAQSLGMEMSTSAAARMMDVPSATWTDTPSISALTVVVAVLGGVP